MAEKVRIYQIAKELDTNSKELLTKLQEMGYEVKSIQNSLPRDEADQIILEFSSTQAPKKTRTKKAPVKKASTKKAPAKKAPAKKAPAKKTATSKKDEEVEEKAPKKSTRSSKKTKKSEEQEEAPKKSTRKAPKKETAKKSRSKAKKEEVVEEVEVDEVEVEEEAFELDNSIALEHGRRLAERLLHFFDDNAAVSLADVRKDRQYLSIADADFSDVSAPERRELFQSITYILGKVDSYHFEGENRFSLIEESQENEASQETEELSGLATIAADLAMRMQGLGKSILIDALNSQQRREIHTALADENQINTFSDGEGIFRRLVIQPGGQNSNSDRSRRR